MRPKVLAAAVIALLIFCLTGLLHTQWSFNGDDFGALFYVEKAIQTNDLTCCLTDGDLNKDLYPSNIADHPKATFFSVYYRPLLCTLMLIEYKLFGPSGYGYLLLNSIIHALNAVLLFFLLLYFIGIFPAFLLTLLFGFHPQIGFRFGHIVNIQYYLNLTFFFMITFLLKAWLDRKKNFFLFTSYFLFFLSTLIRETGLIIPVLIPFGCYLYHQQATTYSFKTLFKFIRQKLLPFAGFFLISLFYIGLRIFFYPLHISNTSDNAFFMLIRAFQNISSHWYAWVGFLYDFFALSWLPYGHRNLKTILLIMLLSLMFWLFAYNRKKLLIIFLSVSLILLLWPCIAICYSPRYLYEVQPLILLILACLFQFYKNKTKLFFQTTGLIALCGIVPLLMVSTVSNLSIRAKKMETINNAIQKIIRNPQLKNRAWCFLSYPLDGFGSCSITQACKALSRNLDALIFTDATAGLAQADSNVFISTKWMLSCSIYFTKNYLSKKPVTGGFRFTSHNPSKIHFYQQNICDQRYSLGKKIVHKTTTLNGQKIIADFSLLIDSQWLKHKTCFLVWDYETKNFIILS